MGSLNLCMIHHDQSLPTTTCNTRCTRKLCRTFKLSRNNVSLASHPIRGSSSVAEPRSIDKVGGILTTPAAESAGSSRPGLARFSNPWRDEGNQDWIFFNDRAGHTNDTAYGIANSNVTANWKTFMRRQTSQLTPVYSIHADQWLKVRSILTNALWKINGLVRKL